MEVTKPKLLTRALDQSVMEKRPLGKAFGRISKTKGKTLVLYRDQFNPKELEASVQKAKKMGYDKISIEKQPEDTGNGPCGKLCHCQERCQYL